MPQSEFAGCLNCGAQLEGEFCHTCGQKRTSLVVPLRELLEELADGLFSVDNRLWKTVATLFGRPGQLTTAYLAGQRIRFWPPFRLYLWMSVGYFLLGRLTGSGELMFITSSSESDMAELLPRVMFAIVPVSAGILHLLNRKSQRLYAEHLTHALHLHAAWFVFFAVTLASGHLISTTEDPLSLRLWEWPIFLAGVAARLAVPVYTFRSMRVVYGLGRGAAVLRTFGFFVLYMAASGLAVFGWMSLTRSL